MITDTFKATGELQIVLRDEHGNIKEDRTVPNLVVTVGKNLIASRLTGVAANVMSHMAVGTSATAPAAGDLILGAEIGGSRVALNVAGGTAVLSDITYIGTFGAGVGTGAIVEAGIFNAASGSGGFVNTMLCHTTFLVVNKAAADSLTITWKVTIQ
jgi:hypothetical protein